MTYNFIWHNHRWFLFRHITYPGFCRLEAQGTSCIGGFLGRPSVRHHVPGVFFLPQDWVVFFAWVGLMVWAKFDVQIGKAKRID